MERAEEIVERGRAAARSGSGSAGGWPGSASRSVRARLRMREEAADVWTEAQSRRRRDPAP